ncbi:hypothetical protein PybrP1_010252 [[Pythium] brassicae (nom. inval.)]|nr:hypothetical protein PybrP1_010252 [[Pythium] brassicae (nom. inval.)]
MSDDDDFVPSEISESEASESNGSEDAKKRTGTSDARPKKRALAGLYFRASELPDGAPVMSEVARLVDTKRVRNFIRCMRDIKNPEDRLKDMLHAFVQVLGNDALVIQDQQDATCGMVMQTEA